MTKEVLMRELYYYLRDPKNRPVVTVCLLIDGTQIARGVAICSNRDVPYKKRGRGIAKARALYALALRGSPDVGSSIPGLRINRREAISRFNDIDDLAYLRFKSWRNPPLEPFEQRLLSCS